MPKEDNDNGDDVEEKRRGKTVEDWVDKGWSELPASKNATATDEVTFDHSAKAFVLFGQMFDESGKKLKGRNRPHVATEETATGTVVVFSEPLKAGIILLYKLESIET